MTTIPGERKIRIMQWANLIGLLAFVAGAATYIGELKGKVDALDSKVDIEHIETVSDTAVEKIEKAAEGFSNLRSLRTQIFKWSQDQKKPVQMIKVKEGICYLVYVTGKFEGGGEAVKIYEDGDYWFLGGRSKQDGIAAHARCWKFTTR